MRLLFLLLLVLLSSCGEAPPKEAKAGRDFLSVATALSSVEAESFARVTGPRAIVLPDDHGAHPDFQLEWWYWTGNLEDEEGRPYGFQLTFFRSALAATEPDGPSAWQTNQSYMAHFALSDPERGIFAARERFARGAAGLAGAEAAPFRVWLDDWRAWGVAGAIEHCRLIARDDGLALDLELKSSKPLVLQGDGGFSAKGEEPGNASMYLSFTRIAAEGQIEIGGRKLKVKGSAWMDHEWSTSVLGPEVAGWDWFSLQLDDGRELMLFNLRGKSDGKPRAGSGTLVAADGSSRQLSAEDFEIVAGGRFESTKTGAVYPATWTIKLPGEGIELEVEPLMADQELAVSVAYWEGAVKCRGRSARGELTGRGFVELVGYSESEEMTTERSR